MKGTTHRVGGICSGICVGVVMSSGIYDLPIMMTLGISSGIVGSLLPDIDEPKSMIGKRLRPISRTFKFLFGHRGIVHTPAFLAVLLVLLLGLAEQLGFNEYYMAMIWGFTWGYGSHLLLDFLTPGGIMLLYPILIKRFRFLGLKGKWRENFACVLMVMITIAFIGIHLDIGGCKGLIDHYIFSTV